MIWWLELWGSLVLCLILLGAAAGKARGRW